jgi:hypothetical protein
VVAVPSGLSLTPLRIIIIKKKYGTITKKTTKLFFIVVETSDHMLVSTCTAIYCVNFAIVYINADKSIEGRGESCSRQVGLEAVCTGLTGISAQVLQGEAGTGKSLTSTVEYSYPVSSHSF